MDVIWRRKKNWICQELQENMLREVIEGRILGKRPRGRKRKMKAYMKSSSLDKGPYGTHVYASVTSLSSAQHGASPNPRRLIFPTSTLYSLCIQFG